MNSLTYTDPEGIKNPVELVRRHDTPRFYVVRVTGGRRVNQTLHVNAPELTLNGRMATVEQLDELLTAHAI